MLSKGSRDYRTLLFLFFFVIGGIVFSAATPIRGTDDHSRLNFRSGAAQLDASDKTALVEALRLRAELGEEIWPGFGRDEIPAILYDDDFEYLFGEPNPPKPWKIVVGDDFQGKPYFRRPADNPQAFAVDLGERWAGSLSTLSRMNRKIPMKLGPDWYSLGLLHEIFHAFQAESAPKAFAAARAVYALEARYPFKNPDFAAAWDAEGAALARALKTTEIDEMKAAAGEFLRIREARRKANGGLAGELIDFEQKLEWLEGLAKYVEIRADELAVARSDQEAYARFRAGLHFTIRADFGRLEKALGRQEGDLRFYLSGMAMARLLDRLDPGWKGKALKEKTIPEDLLRTALEKYRP